jgi:hypothetical protein
LKTIKEALLDNSPLIIEKWITTVQGSNRKKAIDLDPATFPALNFNGLDLPIQLNVKHFIFKISKGKYGYRRIKKFNGRKTINHSKSFFVRNQEIDARENSVHQF